MTSSAAVVSELGDGQPEFPLISSSSIASPVQPPWTSMTITASRSMENSAAEEATSIAQLFFEIFDSLVLETSSSVDSVQEVVPTQEVISTTESRISGVCSAVDKIHGGWGGSECN